MLHFWDVGYGGVELELDQACMNQESLGVCLFNCCGLAWRISLKMVGDIILLI